MLRHQHMSETTHSELHAPKNVNIKDLPPVINIRPGRPAEANPGVVHEHRNLA